jgi:hypothetical protein
VAPLFGRRRERRAQDRAARAEVERLTALARRDLAVEVMAAFGPDGPHPLHLPHRGLNLIDVTEWMLRAHPRPARHVRALAGPVRDALRLLEEAGLIEWHGSEMVGARARLSATALGEVALRGRTVLDYLEYDGEEEGNADARP